MTEKLYKPRDIESQGQTYFDHITAIREEGLCLKSSIAAELAHRDIEIERLKKELKDASKDHDKESEEIMKEREYWHDKATELAEDIGKHFGFEVGEHTNINCPVQNAIDFIYHQ